MHLPHRDNMLEAYEEDEYGKAHVLITANVYTKAEELRAKRAYEFLSTSGFPSLMETIHLVEDGNFYQIPSITRDDFRWAYDIYGIPPAYVNSRETKRQVNQTILDGM
jgi:hypothetical protein